MGGGAAKGLTATEVGAYLGRIGYGGPTAPTVATLGGLCMAHLRAVPFENFDVHLGRPLGLDPEAAFRKVVGERRGGWCFELNGLFARLLAALGYRVTLLAPRFAREDGGYGPEFDHLALLVETGDGDPTRWLADVGCGRNALRAPVSLETGEVQPQPGGGACRVQREGDRWRLWQRAAGGGNPPGGSPSSGAELYAFTLEARRLEQFAGRCRALQTEPDSPFVRGRVCTLHTPEGWIALVEGQLLTATAAGRTEEAVPDEAAFRAVLRERFGMDLAGLDSGGRGVEGAGRAGG